MSMPMIHTVKRYGLKIACELSWKRRMRRRRPDGALVIEVQSWSTLQCVELLIMFMFYKDVFMHKMSYYCFYALSMFIGVYVLFLSF